jgi:hypothetical protein
MFPFGSFACSFVAGFLPLFSDNYDCSIGFVVAMALSCIASLFLRYKLKSHLEPFLGGLACYYISLTLITAVEEVLHPKGQFDFGWFLFAYIVMLPRAAFSSSIGLAAWEIYRITNSLILRDKKNG